MVERFYQFSTKLFRILFRQKPGDISSANVANALSHAAAFLIYFNASALDLPLFTAFYTITFKVHKSSSFREFDFVQDQYHDFLSHQRKIVMSDIFIIHLYTQNQV